MENKVAILRDESNYRAINAWFNEKYPLMWFGGSDEYFFHIPPLDNLYALDKLQPGYTLAKDFEEFLRLVEGEGVVDDPFRVFHLLPCPFCGTKPTTIHKAHPSGISGVRCTHCLFTIKWDRHDKSAGIWNMRKPDAIKDQLISAYDESLQLTSKYALLGTLMDEDRIKLTDLRVRISELRKQLGI